MSVLDFRTKIFYIVQPGTVLYTVELDPSPASGTKLHPAATSGTRVAGAVAPPGLGPWRIVDSGLLRQGFKCRPRGILFAPVCLEKGMGWTQIKTLI
eukprot:SAG11_NODE_10388_length_835_cov_1.754076_2_plen_97_part_00